MVDLPVCAVGMGREVLERWAYCWVSVSVVEAFAMRWLRGTFGVDIRSLEVDKMGPSTSFAVLARTPCYLLKADC